MRLAEPQPTSLTLEAVATIFLPTVEVQTIIVTQDLEDPDIETFQLIIQQEQAGEAVQWK